MDFINIIKLIFGLIFTGKIHIDGLNSGKQLEKLINNECNKREIENICDIKMPLVIPTVDMCEGNVVCFTSKSIRKTFSDNVKFISNMNIGKAVRSSCSFPVVFSPCSYNGTKLIDGGIRENVPWKETKLMGADKVLSIMFEDENNSDCSKNIIEVASRSIGLLSKELSNYEMEGSDYTIKIKSKKIGLLDMSKIDELYELGYKTVKKESKELSTKYYNKDIKKSQK